MARKYYKIKRHRKYSGSYHAKPHPLSIILGIVLVAALVFVGVLIYEPVYNFIMADHSATKLPEQSQSEPEPVSEVEEPEPEPELPQPEITSLKTVYLPITAASTSEEIAAMIAPLSGTEINAVMIDIKAADGTILFNSKNELAAQYGAILAQSIDISELSATLAEKNIQLVVRMSVFRDAIAAGANRNMAISYRDTDFHWLDNSADLGGKPWLNPYSAEAQQYITDLAVEAAEQGASMVVLDNFNFPSGSQDNANFGTAAAGITRPQVLGDFLKKLTATLEQNNARTAVYIPAITFTQEYENTTRYGGSPADFLNDATLILGALPYQFGGDYNAGGLTVAAPLTAPDTAVKAIMDYTATLPLSGLRSTVVLLQGGNETDFNATHQYTAEDIQKIIDAATGSSEGSEYILYSSTGQYLLG